MREPENWARLRLGLILALLSCAAALLLCATAGHSETLVTVGASAVSSSGLGYESPYAGARVEAENTGQRIVLRSLVAVYDAHKIDRDGYGLRAELFAGYRFGEHVTLSAGARYLDQVTDGLHKSGLAPAVELEIRSEHLALRLGADRLREPDDRQDGLSAELRTRGRWQAFGRYERVRFESAFASGTGERVEAGVVYRVNY